MSATVAASVTLAGAAVALVALIALHLMPTGLSPLDDPVSAYGITRFRRGYRVLTVALGIAGLAAAAGVALARTAGASVRHVPPFEPGSRAEIVVLLAIFGLCRLVISWAPMDAPGRPRTSTGTAHVVLAIGAFVAAGAAANRMHRALSASGPAVDAVRGAFLGAFALIVIGLVGQVVLRRITAGHTGYGAAERLVYAGIFVLLASTGLALL